MDTASHHPRYRAGDGRSSPRFDERVHADLGGARSLNTYCAVGRLAVLGPRRALRRPSQPQQVDTHCPPIKASTPEAVESLHAAGLRVAALRPQELAALTANRHRVVQWNCVEPCFVLDRRARPPKRCGDRVERHASGGQLAQTPNLLH